MYNDAEANMAFLIPELPLLKWLDISGTNLCGWVPEPFESYRLYDYKSQRYYFYILPSFYFFFFVCNTKFVLQMHYMYFIHTTFFLQIDPL